MVQFAPFQVERVSARYPIGQYSILWMDEYETLATHNLAETCCASISLDQLQDLSEDKKASVLSAIQSTPMTYGEVPGLKALRENLASLYSSRTPNPLPADNILITPGAIMANHLIFYSLIGPGDHVICHYPTYQQLFSTPESLGAEVDLWKADQNNNWQVDIKQLQSLVKDNTKMIIINNPQNPTGAILGKQILEKVIEIASAKNIIILSDEVYRPIFHSISPMDSNFPPSILSMSYKNTIAVGSLSKAYSLAGIRTGWLASRNPDIIDKIANARHYTTITVSQLDSAVAAFALAPHTVHALIGRNIKLAKTNLEILENWIGKHSDICKWVKPVAGTTAFVQFRRDGQPVDTEDLCRKLVEEEKVLWVPGDHSFGKEFKGYVRIGYVCETDVLKAGLDKVDGWLRQSYQTLKIAS